MTDRRRSRLTGRPWALAVVAAAAVCVVALATALANPKPNPSRILAEPIDIDATPIRHFDKARPKLVRFGRLEFRGGLVLTSPNSNFGGWSGLAVDADGRKLLAISDAGSWMLAEIDYDGIRPKGLKLARIGAIAGLGGRPLVRERERDAEGVSLVDGTLSGGTVLISFERVHRIGRFPVSDKGLGAPTGYLPLPPETRRMSPNRSLESVCMLRAGSLKGAIVTLAERFPSRTGDHVGWLLPVGGGAWSTLSIRNVGGFDLVDCAGLPDGSMLVLERRFRWSEMLSGVRSQLRLVRQDELRSGGLIQGELLLEADLGFEIDNLEGLAVHRGPAGETVLTMISDDNFNTWMQRTVLLQFTLHEAAEPAVAKGAGR